MSVDKILFRCSSLGYIMTEPKEKSPYEKWQEADEKVKKLNAEYDAIPTEKLQLKASANKFNALTKAKQIEQELRAHKDDVLLSETCKGHLADKYVSVKYGRETEIENKYIKKGLQCEEDSITLYSRLKKKVFFKNEEQLTNEWISGTPDLFRKNGDTIELVIDTKTSWDIFTFHRAKIKALDSRYYWQAMGYLDLTGAQQAIIAFCLINTPTALIYDECKKLQWKMGVTNPDTDELYKEACQQIERNMTYDDIPLEEKMFEVIVNRNDEDIERMHTRVIECREYMRVHLFGEINLTIEQKAAA